MLKAQKLTLAVLIQATLISSAYASEQSEAQGFVEGASASVLFRTGFIDRDKKNVAPGDDTRSTVQSVMLNAESGFTQGTVGVAVGVVGDYSVKLGDNKHSGNQMVPRETGLNDKGVLTKGVGSPYDQWARGGAYVKARVSNTTVTYGTQVMDIPVLASNT